MLKRKSVSSTEEKRIVTGLIISTKFNELIKPILKLDYFTNSYLAKIAMWCDTFYTEYEKAPYMHIKDIFEAEQQRDMKDTEIELIDTLLKSLSDQYDRDSINVPYLVETAGEYFRKREIEIAVNNISYHKDKGDYEEAEREIEKFTKVSTDLDYGAIINPGDLVQQEEIYRQMEEDDKNFFKFPGDLGRYLGNQKRGDVVGYYAPAKKGKSFVLVDNFKHGVLNRRKTLFYSIEMTKTEILPRINKSFFPMVDEDEGEYTYPTFDCLRNQEGTCRFRESPVVIYENDEFIDDPAHVVCRKCMHHPFKEDLQFEMAVYQDTIYRHKNDIFTVRKKHKAYQKLWNQFGRISVHPKYTLTYDTMMMDIDALFKKDQFIPDILIVDYIDILGIDSHFDDYRLEDERWKLMAKVAGECNCLVITATQANKAGHEAKVLDATHQGGFYGKNRHVNLMVGLNQNSDEKEQGIMRFGISEARNVPFIPGRTCTVLQDYKAGQAHLESYYR